MKPAKFVLTIIIALILGVGAYFLLSILFLGALFFDMERQMKAGQQYMNSITEKDIPVWIERTEKFLKEYNPNNSNSGTYGSKDKPVPRELRSMKIIEIVIFEDRVFYKWLGGMDHTYLLVEKDGKGNYKFTAGYNDENSKVIWPKKDVNLPGG